MPFLRNTPMILLTSNKSTIKSAIRKSWLQRQQKDVFNQKARQTGYPSRSIFKLEQIYKMMTNLIQSKRNKDKKETISSLLVSTKNGNKNDIKLQSNGIAKDVNHNKKMESYLFEKGKNVLDLGASPGSWSMYSNQKIKNGLHVSVDLCPLSNSIIRKIQSKNPNFYFLHGDFCSKSIQQSLCDLLLRYKNQCTVGRRRNTEKEENQIIEINNEISNSDKFDVIMSDMAANFTGDQLTDALRTMNLCEEALLVALGTQQSPQQQNMKSEDGFSMNNGILNKHGVFLCKFFPCGKEQESELMEKVKGCFEHVFILKPKASRKESSEKYLVAFDYKG